MGERAMKGYVEIPVFRVLSAANNYDKMISDSEESYGEIKKRLESIKHKGMFFLETEWDKCFDHLLFPNLSYINKNHPELSTPMRIHFYGAKTTDAIRALALEGVEKNVLCDQDLAEFVGEWA